LDSKVNVISDHEHELEVKVGYEELTDDLNEAYKEEQKKISAPGFRKGKVPLAMVKKMHGEAIEFQATEKIANKKFWDLVQEKNLNPISAPQMTDLNFDPGKELTFKIKYEVMPKLKLKDYKDLTIDKPIFDLKEEDVEKEVDHMLRAHSDIKEAEVVEDKNHRIFVNLQRLDKGNVPIVGSRNENMLFDLSDERSHPQIAESAIGKKVNDTFKFSFTNEQTQPGEVPKEEFYFTAEITKIEKYVFPEITEELIKKMSGDKVTTLEELKNLIKKNIEDYYNKQSDGFYTNALLNKIVENNDLEAPKGYTENLLHKLVEYEKENANRQKLDNFNEKDALENLKPKAEWNAKWQIILDNIAKQERIKLDDSEIEVLVKEEAEKTGISEQKLMKFYKDSNRTEALLEEKVVNFLKEKNKVNEFDPAERVKKEKEMKKTSKKKG